VTQPVEEATGPGTGGASTTTRPEGCIGEDRATAHRVIGLVDRAFAIMMCGCDIAFAIDDRGRNFFRVRLDGVQQDADCL
jgi:hypothetical protein